MTERAASAEGVLLREGFTAIPNAVLRDLRLGAHARLLYAVLLDLAWRQDEPEQDDLATLVGVTAKPLRMAINELKDAGLLTVKRRGQGRTNTYTVHEPQNGSTARSKAGATPGPSFKDLQEDGEVEADASTSSPGKVSTRPRRVVFDALVAATNANPADGGMIGKAEKAIRTAEADNIRRSSERFLAENPQCDEAPQDAIDKWLAAKITLRAAEYRAKRPEWELTPTALAKHWNRIPTWKTSGGRMTAAEIARLGDDA